MTRHPDYGHDLNVDLAQAEALLAEPALTEQSREMGSQLAAAIDALLDDVGLLVPSMIDRKHLQAGSMALRLPMNLDTMTSQELELLRRGLADGVEALQAVEALGSEEHNAAVRTDCEALMRRLAIVTHKLSVMRPTTRENIARVKAMIAEFDEGNLSALALVGEIPGLLDEIEKLIKA